MDFVLALHSHLPWVLHHGRWPHGSDWLTEAAVDTYLPLLETLLALEHEGVNAPVSLGITPVLANQLAHPSFGAELETFIARRLEYCAEAPAALASTGDAHLVPIAAYWEQRLQRLRGVFHAAGGDLVRAFRELERRGRLEIFSCAATHGFLPLLGRDESIRLQLLAGRDEHRRLFGRAPDGCWAPECAFRPAGPWQPEGATPQSWRRGTDEFLREAGYRYFFVDAHLVQAGGYLGQYHDVPLGAERFDAARQDPDTYRAYEQKRSPYAAYRMPGPPGAPPVHALVRDPRSSQQVWSRGLGYPGDEWYLEFHKMRWPGGLKLWRVSASGADLGGKLPYEPAAARVRAAVHAAHFASLLAETARGSGTVITAPFDTELFGHWWAEGVDFIADLYRALPRGGHNVQPVTASVAVRARARRPVVRLEQGSWGANGDFSMWLNPTTAWTWQRLWPLEDAFWGVARAGLAGEGPHRAVLAQAARALLLAQASDWQFVISTGAAADYAGSRFALHCGDAERLVAALDPAAPAGALESAAGELEGLRRRDDLFPEVLDAVAEALA